MSKSILNSILVAAGLVTASLAGRAEGAPAVHWYAMTGYSDTVGTTSDYLQGGYILSGGVSISPSWSAPIDFRFEGNYSQYNASLALVNNGQMAGLPVDSGTGSIWSGTANVVYNIPIVYGVRAYGIGGVGVYHTRIDLNQTLPYSYGGCTYYYGCGYGYGYAEVQVASHGVTDFGWNAGVGVEFALPYGHSWFIESRYNHINSSTAVQFLPIEVGFRF